MPLVLEGSSLDDVSALCVRWAHEHGPGLYTLIPAVVGCVLFDEKAACVDAVLPPSGKKAVKKILINRPLINS